MVTTITVTGTYEKPHGAAAYGSVTFLLANPILDSDGNVIVYPADDNLSRADLDSNGSFSIDLAATNEPGTEPSGNTYLVKEAVNGSTRSFNIEVPYDADGATIDLADVAPVASGTIRYGLASPSGASVGDLLRVSGTDPVTLEAIDSGTFRRDASPVPVVCASVQGTNSRAVHDWVTIASASARRHSVVIVDGSGTSRMAFDPVVLPQSWENRDIRAVVHVFNHETDNDIADLGLMNVYFNNLVPGDYSSGDPPGGFGNIAAGASLDSKEMKRLEGETIQLSDLSAPVGIHLQVDPLDDQDFAIVSIHIEPA